jgi:hypothetical protein
MLLTIEGRSAPRDKQETTMTKKMMLKTVLTFAALTLAQLSTAHAGGGYPGSNSAGQTPKHVFPGDTGLPAHHSGGDVKPPKPQLLRDRIPPKIHGPFPGPMPGVDPRTQ